MFETKLGQQDSKNQIDMNKDFSLVSANTFLRKRDMFIDNVLNTSAPVIVDDDDTVFDDR